MTLSKQVTVVQTLEHHMMPATIEQVHVVAGQLYLLAAYN
jgi:hypothetical protein